MNRLVHALCADRPGPGLRAIALILGLLIPGLAALPAQALPAFAAQTGQPCQMCHVGGFGPELTPYGRNFKLTGYTQRATSDSIPLSAMAIASYVRTAKPQSPPPASGFGANDNTALDQFSLFLAGGLGRHLGGFVQATWDGVAKAWTWDNLDVRATQRAQIRGRDVVLGVGVNNSPTVEDAWNTLPAWGYPFTSSTLAPGPTAAPLLSGALAQTTLGASAYAFIDSKLYIEAAAYGSPSAGFLRGVGADPTSPGDLDGLSPYGRIAYQTLLAGGTAELGAFALDTRLHPGLDRSTGRLDRYRDLGVDASFQRALANGDVVALNSRVLHEHQALAATCVLAGAPVGACDSRLTDIRADVSYYWRNEIGLTVQGFDEFGAANPVLYQANRTLRPDSSGVMVQLDATPFGGRGQPARRLNLRVGVQYTAYARINGARLNFDGLGRRASDDNTLRIFTWIAF